MFGTNSPKIREKLINVGRDLTLQKAIQIGQNYEYAQEQMKQMTPNDVHMVKPKTKRRVKRSNRSGTTMGQRQSYGATGFTLQGYEPQTGTNKTRRHVNRTLSVRTVDMTLISQMKCVQPKDKFAESAINLIIFNACVDQNQCMK